MLKRWSDAGLRFPVDDYHLSLTLNNLVQDDRDGFTFAQETAYLEASRLVRIPFHINVGNEAEPILIGPLALPDVPTNVADIITIIYAIPTQCPHRLRSRQIFTILEFTYDDCLKNTTLTAYTLAHCLAEVGHIRAPDADYIAQLRIKHLAKMRTHMDSLKWCLESVFSTTSGPSGSTSYGAQFVNRNEYTGNWKYPLLYSDISLGYMYSPNMALSIDPWYIGYSDKSSEAAQTEVANKDAVNSNG